MVSIFLSAIVIAIIIDFYKNYNESTEDFNIIQNNYQTINNWLTYLQTIIFKKWKYFNVINNELAFTTVENWIENKYFLKLDFCNNWNWKTLYYYNSSNNVNLFSNKCITWINWISFPVLNNEIKEKVQRVKIETENWDFFSTLYVSK